MFSNYRPKDEYRKENNPHTPSNVPDDLEDRCHRVFEHVENWSINAGAVKYVYPKTEEGYNDYAVMLDIMGFEPGNIIEYRNDSTSIRMFVIERFDIHVKWGDVFTVTNGGVKVYRSDQEKTRNYDAGEGYNPKNLWRSYIYGQIEVVGHIDDI